MKYIENIKELTDLYGEPGQASLVKVARKLTPSYRKWIMQSRFCVLSTVGPEGTDGSPRGDTGPVVVELDEHTLLLPDWKGNNRIDTLRNIVNDPRISLMFLVAGSTTVLRVNGEARITVDTQMRHRFEHKGKHPRSVIVVKIGEVYPQCARAVMRAGLWVDGDQSAGLPTIGEMLKEMTSGEFDGETYDREWPDRAKASLW